MVKMKVVWTQLAKEDLQAIFLYLKKRSPQAARKVRKTLLDMSKALGQYPEMYAQNRFMEEENIRSFTKWSYRVTYQIKETSIDILQVEHTSQEPTTNFE